MSTYHRKSRFANPNICPCHGSAPHVNVKKEPPAKPKHAKKPAPKGRRSAPPRPARGASAGRR